MPKKIRIIGRKKKILLLGAYEPSNLKFEMTRFSIAKMNLSSCCESFVLAEMVWFGC